MKVLIIGGNSYIAKAFVARWSEKIECTSISRTKRMQDYFELGIEQFQGYDAILNCAAIVHTQNPEPELSVRINTELPLFLAKRAIAAGIPHFIQMSTIAVYGSKAEQIDIHTHEAPDSVYSNTKYEADTQLLALQNPSFAVSLFRPPIIYGPQAPGNMQSLIRLIRTFPMLPFDYRKNRRSILFVGNLVNAIEQCLVSKSRGILLVCDEEHPSLFTLCSTISSQLALRRFFFSLPEWQIRLFQKISSSMHKLYGSLLIDDSETQKQLGRYAIVPFDDAIGQTVTGTPS